MIKKSYMRVIMEDLSPYLFKVYATKNSTHSRYKLRYTFNIRNCSETYILDMFKQLATTQRDWKKLTPNVYIWETNSIKLKEWFYKQEIYPSEGIEDIPSGAIESIPSHMVDASIFNIDHTITGRFKQKEKEMNDNFKIDYNLNINVNGNTTSLTLPINKNKALNAVLQLNNRLNQLSDQLSDLKSVNSKVDEVQTDTIDLSNVVSIVTDEINEIKEAIEYINDNIEE